MGYCEIIKFIRRYIFVIVIFIVVTILSIMVLCNARENIQRGVDIRKPFHHTEKGFRNLNPALRDRNFGDFLKWILVERRTNKKNRENWHYPIEKVENDGAFLRNNHNSFTVTWVGHSTLLIQLDSVTILTDPMWSNRASPFQFAGPKRHTEPGLTFENLPRIDIVIISHDHYDHLDKTTINKLGNTPLYLVPLGVGKFLKNNNIDNYRELDWWEMIHYKGLEFVCTPSQHFSGRTPFNRNETLWCSWVVNGKTGNFYFCGDSGYFSGFCEIDDKYGPFDLVALPIGAYLPQWFMGPVHLSPAEALHVFKELRGRKFIPIHWGTFKLADDPIENPPAVLLEEIKKATIDNEDIWMLKHGETRIITTRENLKSEEND